MDAEWHKVHLRDHVDLLTGFPFKSALYVDGEDGIRLLRGANVGQGFLKWDKAKRWAEESKTDIERYQLDEDDVILAMDRPWIDAGLK